MLNHLDHRLIDQCLYLHVQLNQLLHAEKKTPPSFRKVTFYNSLTSVNRPVDMRPIAWTIKPQAFLGITTTGTLALLITPLVTLPAYAIVELRLLDAITIMSLLERVAKWAITDAG